VCGLGYDENNEATDYEAGFGDFDTCEEAYALFDELANRSEESFFVSAANVYEIEIRLEECEETEDLIECVDIIDEFSVINPSFEEEI
jgi:hypothetical protein